MGSPATIRGSQEFNTSPSGCRRSMLVDDRRSSRPALDRNAGLSKPGFQSVRDRSPTWKTIGNGP